MFKAACVLTHVLCAGPRAGVWLPCRSWMELQSDAALLQGCSGANLDPQAQAAAQAFYLGQAGDSSDAEVGQKHNTILAAAVCVWLCSCSTPWQATPQSTLQPTAVCGRNVLAIRIQVVCESAAQGGKNVACPVRMLLIGVVCLQSLCCSCACPLLQSHSVTVSYAYALACLLPWLPSCL